MAESEIKELDNLRIQLSTLRNQMLSIQQRIHQLEKDIYIKCNHVWSIDRTNVGERTEQICMHCGMYKTI